MYCGNSTELAIALAIALALASIDRISAETIAAYEATVLCLRETQHRGMHDIKKIQSAFLSSGKDMDSYNYTTVAKARRCHDLARWNVVSAGGRPVPADIRRQISGASADPEDARRAVVAAKKDLDTVVTQYKLMIISWKEAREEVTVAEYRMRANCGAAREAMKVARLRVEKVEIMVDALSDWRVR